jgi:hypothetical protein
MLVGVFLVMLDPPSPDAAAAMELYRSGNFVIPHEPLNDS